MALSGQTQTPARLLGYINVQLQENGMKREFTEKWAYEHLLGKLREHLSEVEIKKLAAEGAEWSEDQAVEQALRIQTGR